VRLLLMMNLNTLRVAEADDQCVVNFMLGGTKLS